MDTIGDIAPEKARIVHILNTLKLEEMMISEVMISEAEKMDNVSVIGSPQQMAFDAQGNLISDF
jgi:hypothetical protein